MFTSVLKVLPHWTGLARTRNCFCSESRLNQQVYTNDWCFCLWAQVSSIHHIQARVACIRWDALLRNWRSSGITNLIRLKGQIKYIMDEGKMLDWIKQECQPWTTTKAGPTMLILDEFTAHMAHKVWEQIADCGTHLKFIPGGYTSCLQVMDIGLNKPSKDCIHDQYDVVSFCRWFKATTNRGGQLHCPQLGAPYGLDNHEKLEGKLVSLFKSNRMSKGAGVVMVLKMKMMKLKLKLHLNT